MPRRRRALAEGELGAAAREWPNIVNVTLDPVGPELLQARAKMTAMAEQHAALQQVRELA